MFARLGRFAARYRWPLILGWLIVAGVLTLLAPNIASVAVNDQRAFLPTKAASITAYETVKEYFPDLTSPSSAVLVFHATEEGRRVDEGPFRDRMAHLTTWLSDEAAPEVIERVVSPTAADEMTARALTSADGRVSLIIVRFSTVGFEEETHEALSAIEQQLQREQGEGLETYLTGDSAIVSAYNDATMRSVESTTWITILLVVIILLLVYRSPVSPIIPLLTIGLAYLISRAVVALLGDSVITISGYTDIFLIVVLFGAGTDYCLFLISRFREEMADTPESSRAVPETVRTVGETIASSAGTVIVGLSTMALAELGLFNTSGPSVAIGVAIALLAGLTFTPAMLAVLGDHAFWPRKARHMGEGRFWNAWASRVTGHPKTALFATLVVLVPLAIYGQGQSTDFDLLADLPKDTAAREGFEVLSDHLGPGVMSPLTLVVPTDDAWTSPQGLSRLTELQSKLDKQDHVAQVRSFTASLAEAKTLVVSNQLQQYADGVEQGLAQLEAPSAKGGDEASGVAAGGGGERGGGETGAGYAAPSEATAAQQLQQAQKDLLDMFSYLQQLVREYPEVASSPGFQQSNSAFAALSQLGPRAAEGDVPPEVLQALAQLQSGLEQLQKSFADRPDALMLPQVYLTNNEGLRGLYQSYISSGGDAARLQVTLDVGPYTETASATVSDLRKVVAEYSPRGVVEGSSAVLADLRAASDRDMTRAVVFVLAGTLVVLILLLRALVAPVYLILTILVSYGATLGIVRLVFTDILGAGGITWWVPIFMFVMLVALGMDYNIFLMGRVKEEVGKAANRDGVRHALARTGGIITSAGIIMAGTFAAMISANILGLIQIGFAVAVGVLLDTFVVRTALVPAIVVLLGRWSWWPRRRAHGAPNVAPSESERPTP